MQDWFASVGYGSASFMSDGLFNMVIWFIAGSQQVCFCAMVEPGLVRCMKFHFRHNHVRQGEIEKVQMQSLAGLFQLLNFLLLWACL